MRAFSDALDFIPMALAENSGLSSIQTVANIKSRQIAENNSRLGIDCMQNGDCGKTIYLYIYIYIYVVENALIFWKHIAVLVECFNTASVKQGLFHV